MLKFNKNIVILGKASGQKRITPHVLIQTLNTAAKEKVNSARGRRYER